MPATVDEVEQLIREGFPDSDIDIKEENHRVFGTIQWDKFKEMDPWERNKLVTEKIRDPLGFRGVNVGYLIPLASKDEI